MEHEIYLAYSAPLCGLESFVDLGSKTVRPYGALNQKLCVPLCRTPPTLWLNSHEPGTRNPALRPFDRLRALRLSDRLNRNTQLT